MHPSSTSSSDRVGAAAQSRSFPWAGLAALLFVLVSDRWLAAEPRLWDWAVERIDSAQAMELGVARDRAALSRLAHQTADRPRVFVLGSSRAERGFVPAELESVFAGRVELVKLTHAGMKPYEIAALADELVDVGADVVVLALSEFDTHRPLRLMAETAPGSLTVLGDLISLASDRLLKANGLKLQHLALATTLNSYRYRDVATAAGWRLGALFGGGPRAPKQQTVRSPLGLFGRTHDELTTIVARLGLAFPQLSQAARWDELRQVLSITPGEHVLLQRRLLRGAVERLAGDGVAVIVIELPLHPLSRQYYDVTLRDEALSFFGELAMDFGVTVVTEEMSGPYLKQEFADLTHTAGEGAAKLSRSLARTVLEVVEARTLAGAR